jgi:hypothetical protein
MTCPTGLNTFNSVIPTEAEEASMALFMDVHNIEGGVLASDDAGPIPRLEFP